MKIGFIGCGNMASAIINGMLNSGEYPPESIFVSDIVRDACIKLANKGVQVACDNRSLVNSVDCVVLAIKPVYADAVVDQIHDLLQGKLVISIIGSWSSSILKEKLPAAARFVRVMPNTPLAVGEGMSLISTNYTCTQGELDFTQRIFNSAGETVMIEDHAFTAASGISGCGPAFVYQFIEALADGGVRYGVPRKTAYQLACQTLLGSAKMVMESGEHPGALKDAVCSPGGITIEGVYALEKGGLRAAVMDAIGATVEKTNAMSK